MQHMSNRSICPISKTLTGTTTPSQSGSGSNSNMTPHSRESHHQMVAGVGEKYKESNFNDVIISKVIMEYENKIEITCIHACQKVSDNFNIFIS